MENPAHRIIHAVLSGPVVCKQEVLVLAGYAEFEVSEWTTSSVERPDAHNKQDDVGGDKTINIRRVLEGLCKKKKKTNLHLNV